MSTPVIGPSQKPPIAGDDARRQWIWAGKLPCIDGLRAVAILCVIFSHICRNAIPFSWDIGHFGVTAFFVLSGFLITLLLLRERRQTGRVSLAGFYRRRSLRILPAYVVFLSAIGSLQLVGVYKYPLSSWIAATTYTSCFWKLSDLGSNLAHTWSLSVEEQFYLLWPLVFIATTPLRAFHLLSVYVLVVAPVLRSLMGAGLIPLDLNYTSPTQMSSIAVGCMLALVIAGNAAPRIERFLFARAPLLPVLAVGLLLISRKMSIPLKIALSDPVKAVVFALLLAWVLILQRGGVQRLLCSTPLVWGGVLSYSLYLWQQPFTGDVHIRGGVLFRLTALLTAASASYFIVERPFLKLKNRDH